MATSVYATKTTGSRGELKAQVIFADIECTASDHWTTGLVASVSSMRAELALAGVQGLLAAGFVSDGGLDGRGATWATEGTILVITELGSTVLEVLRDVSSASI